MAVNVAHIGLPKSASTFLQKQYFPKLPSYAGRFWSTQQPFAWPKELVFVFETNRVWLEALYCRDHQDRQERLSSWRRYCEVHADRWMESAKRFRERNDATGGPWLLSAEGLCGFSDEVCATHMALLNAAGVKRILFVTRRQNSFSLSLWKQLLLHEDRFARYISFDKLFGTESDAGFVELEWDKYIDVMDKRFGRENVLALPYELLESDPQNFFELIARHLELESVYIPDISARENEMSIMPVYTGLALDNKFPLRKLPRIRAWFHNNVLKKVKLPGWLIRSAEMDVSENVLERIQASMQSSNLRLAERIGIDLGQYGYY